MSTIAEWRAAIEAVRSDRPDIVKLRETSLRFLDSSDAFEAVGNDWDAISLFGMHGGEAPRQRVGSWGLVIFLAWGVHKCTVDAIEPDVCALRTNSGAILRQQRRKADHDHAIPWWQHPGITSAQQAETGGSSHA